MKTLEKLLEELQAIPENRQETDLVVENHKPKSPPKLQSKSKPSDEKNGKPKIRENPIHQDQLADLLNQTYVMLKKYGESADVTEMREAGFQMMLGDYCVEDVIKAFKTYLKTNHDIPTPADIISIIDPSTQPLCPKMYQSLVMRDAELRKQGKMIRLSDDEENYVYEYEKRELKKVYQKTEYEPFEIEQEIK
jgi:hypothetical protein